MDESELLSSLHSKVECKFRYSLRRLGRVDLDGNPDPWSHLELFSDVEIFCVLSHHNHVDIGLQRRDVWKGSSGSHVGVEIEHRTESDRDAPWRSWLFGGCHGSLETCVGLLDHLHGLWRKIGPILRDDIESGLPRQHVKFEISDLLDRVQDCKRRFDNFRADSISRQHCDLVSLSCHRWSQWSARLGGVEKAFPARKGFSLVFLNYG